MLVNEKDILGIVLNFLRLAVTVYRDPPKAELIETGGRLLLTCKKSLQGIAAPLGFDGLLVFLCTLYAVR